MKSWTRLASLGAVALALTSCGGSRESKLIGTWKPRATSVVANGVQGAGSAGSAPAAAAGTAAMAMMSLNFRDDKTFTLTSGAPVEGTWTLDESTGLANMTVTKVAGQTLPQIPGGAASSAMKLTCQLDDANTTLTLNNPTPGASGGLSGLNFEKS